MKNRGRDLQVLPTLVTAGKTSRPDQETIKASDQIKTNFANNNSKICFLMGGDNMFVDVSINVRWHWSVSPSPLITLPTRQQEKWSCLLFTQLTFTFFHYLICTLTYKYKWRTPGILDITNTHQENFSFFLSKFICIDLYNIYWDRILGIIEWAKSR